MITPETVVIANTRARKATAMQNRRSVLHHPAIRSVATTDVAQPLTMLTAQAATSVGPLASSPGRRGTTACRTAPGPPQWGGGCRGICVVGDSGTTGIGPLGARRMIRVAASQGAMGSGALGSAGLGSGGAGAWGSLGAVTSASVVADSESSLSKPWDGVDSFGAVFQDLEMQVRSGGIAPVAHGCYLVAGHHALPGADKCGVDVPVEGDRAVGVAPLDQ